MHLSYHRKNMFFFSNLDLVIVRHSSNEFWGQSPPRLSMGDTVSWVIKHGLLARSVRGFHRVYLYDICVCIYIYMYLHIYIYAHLDPFVGFHKWGYPYIHGFIWEHSLVRGFPNGRGAKSLATCSAGSGAPGKVLCVGPGSLELIGSFQGVSGQKSWWTAFKNI